MKEAQKIISYLKEKGVKNFYYIINLYNLRNVFSFGGILSRRRVIYEKIDFVDIADPEILTRRIKVIVGKNEEYDLMDFVHLYFTNKTPMFYNILNKHNCKLKSLEKVWGRDQNVIIRISLDVVERASFFSNGNAASKLTKFYQDYKDLDKIDWEIVLHRNAYYKEYKRKKACELFVKDKVGLRYFEGIETYSMEINEILYALLEEYNLENKIPLIPMVEYLDFDIFELD